MSPILRLTPHPCMHDRHLGRFVASDEQLQYWTNMLRFLLSLGDVMSAAPLPSIDTLSMTAPSEISTWTGPATFSKLVATILDDLVRRVPCAAAHAYKPHACSETCCTHRRLVRIRTHACSWSKPRRSGRTSQRSWPRTSTRSPSLRCCQKFSKLRREQPRARVPAEITIQPWSMRLTGAHAGQYDAESG